MRIVYFEDMDIGSQLISTRDVCLKEYADVDFTFSYRTYFSDIIQALESNDADLAIVPHGIDFSTATYNVQCTYACSSFQVTYGSGGAGTSSQTAS